MVLTFPNTCTLQFQTYHIHIITLIKFRPWSMVFGCVIIALCRCHHGDQYAVYYHFNYHIFFRIFIPSATKFGVGVYWIHPVCPSVHLSVCPLTFRVRPVASTVHDGFFPYLVQMINSVRGCVECDDPWLWPISSRSFDLHFENGVRSVTFSVLDRLFPYSPQIITTIRECVAC